MVLHLRWLVSLAGVGSFCLHGCNSDTGTTTSPATISTVTTSPGTTSLSSHSPTQSTTSGATSTPTTNNPTTSSGSLTPTTTVSKYTIDTRCLPDGSVQDCVDYLNEQYLGFDPNVTNSPPGVTTRGQPLFRDWYHCGGACFKGFADCYVPSSMLNHKIMLKENDGRKTAVMPMSGDQPAPLGAGNKNGIVFQPQAVAEHLVKCSWHFDGSAFNKLNGGCGCGADNDCGTGHSAYDNVCPSTEQPATGTCPHVNKCSCDVQVKGHSEGNCFWKGPAFDSSATPGAAANLTGGANEIQQMMEQRLREQENDKNPGNMHALQYWNEVVIDGKVMLKLLENNPYTVVAAFLYIIGRHGAAEDAKKFQDKHFQDWGVRVPIIAFDSEVEISPMQGPFKVPPSGSGISI